MYIPATRIQIGARSYIYIHNSWQLIYDMILLNQNQQSRTRFAWLQRRFSTPFFDDNRIIPADSLRNNDVVITSKRGHFDVITSKWCRFDVTTTLLLRHVFSGMCCGGCWSLPNIKSKFTKVTTTWDITKQNIVQLKYKLRSATNVTIHGSRTFSETKFKDFLRTFHGQNYIFQALCNRYLAYCRRIILC